MKNIIEVYKQLFFILLISLLFSPVFTYSQDNNSDIRFSLPAGFYDTTQTISLSSEIPGAEIRVTSNGSEPLITSFKYTSPFKLAKTTVIRARLFSSGLPVSKTFTRTYFINEKTNLPVVSISTNPKNFFDPDTGIYVMGPNPGSEYPYFNANFWKDWERPVHFEFFETSGDREINMEVGVKIFGAWSRAMPQKSLALFARSKYGSGKIRYKLFEDRTVSEFESIVLRNSGNDWDYTLMRDALMQSLVSGIDLETQAYRPAVLFINGEYWGIHNIREKINEHFIASYHNVHPDSIDILENNGSVILGGNTHYKSLISFISSADLSKPQNYTYVKLRMDVDNFINYELAQIYFNNTDWPGNNIKFWRPQRDDGRWRWLLYDTDFGFGLYGDRDYQENTLNFATASNSTHYANLPWSTLILRKLLTNQDFRNSFISRFSEFAGTIFKPDAVVGRIRNYKSVIEPEIPRHLQRWGTRTYDNWVKKVTVLETFAQNRINYMLTHFSQKFSLTETRLLTINVENPDHGSVKLDAVKITNFPWSSSFYKGIPLTITAVPSAEYMFKEWKGIDGVPGNSFIFNFTNNLSITPVFVPDTSARPYIVINEVNYNSSADFDCEDWIEIYNNSDSTVDLSGWMVKDGNEDNSFLIPGETQLPGRGYLVLCSDTAKFAESYPGIKNKVGDLGFSISNSGELIRILDSKGRYIDSVRFSDKSPWPSEPDGTGATLSLKNSNMDNYLAQNWSASLNHGTPGAVNDVMSFVSSLQNSEIEFIMEQNYPNPFNSSTRFHYAFAGSDNIQFRVYNVLGKQVYFEDQGFRTPGFYEVNFSAARLPSGTYYYQISTSIRTLTKMMIVIK